MAEMGNKKGELKEKLKYQPKTKLYVRDGQMKTKHITQTDTREKGWSTGKKTGNNINFYSCT